MRVRAHAWDCSAGGRDLDAQLLTHCEASLDSSARQRLSSEPSARLLMAQQVTACREQLSESLQADILIPDLSVAADTRCASPSSALPISGPR
jgi:molecular chaperone DnaK (HSP70)